MDMFINPPRERWAELCRRAGSGDTQIAARVEAIVERVAREGDKALYALAEEIDGVRLAALRVSEEEFSEAEQAVGEELKRAIDVAIANISAFRRAQLPHEVRV